VRIATWNVNSIKVRAPSVLDWIAREHPDAVLLQEIKCEAGAFPLAAFAEAGYSHATVAGEKAYNGVAVLTRDPHDVVLTRLPGDGTDEHARYIEVDLNDVRIACLYLPNGNPTDTPKFPYKLGWMDRLIARARALLETETPFLMGGDWNVIPEPRDVWDPRAMEGDALTRPETLARFRTLLNLGLTDAFRALRDDPRAYTFWDYQAGAWPRDAGMRIDHFLLSPRIADRLVDCRIDREPRGSPRASDHTPVILALA